MLEVIDAHKKQKLAIEDNVTVVQGTLFTPEQEVIAQLYRHSATNYSQTHLEGKEALESALNRIRLPEPTILLTELTTFAALLFAKLPEVEGILYYGGAVKGKERTSDLDLRIVTKPMPSSTEGGWEFQVENSLQTKIRKDFERLGITRTVHGLPIEHLFIETEYLDIYNQGLSYLEGKYHLAFIRGEALPGSSFGPMRVYLNTSDTTSTK